MLLLVIQYLLVLELVVDQCVDAAESFDGRLAYSLHGVWLSDVERQNVRAVVPLRFYFFELGFSSRNQSDVRPSVEKTLGHSAANPAAGSGDDDRLVVH